MTTQNPTAQDTHTPDEHQAARWYGAGCHIVSGFWVVALHWLVFHYLTNSQWSFAMVDVVLVTIGLLGPLGLCMSSRGRYPFVNRQYREVVNFQIAIALNTLLFGLLSFGYFIAALLVVGIEDCGKPAQTTAGFDPLTHPIIGFFTVLGVIRITQVGIAAWKAASGRSHRYPFILRFLR